MSHGKQADEMHGKSQRIPPPPLPPPCTPPPGAHHYSAYQGPKVLTLRNPHTGKDENPFFSLAHISDYAFMSFPL